MRGLKLTILLLSMLTMMAAAIIAPSLPDIAREFSNLPDVELLSKLILSLPALMIAIFAPFVGRYIDRFGRLKLLYIGLIGYAISGTSGYFSSDLYFILLGRMLLGVSISIIMTIAATLIGDFFEGKARQRFIGYQTAFIGMAGVIFLIMGGLLATVHWRMPFLIYLVSLIMIPLGSSYLKESKPIIIPSNNELTSPKLLKILFLVGTLFMILFYLMPTQLPFLLKSIGINDPSYAGYSLAVNALGIVCSSLSYGWIKQQFSFLSVAWLSLMMMGGGYFLTGYSATFGSILASVFLAGLGLGLFIANLNFWILELSPALVRGKNMGILTACLFFGQFSSPIVAEPIIRYSDLASLFVSALLVIGFMGITLTVTTFLTDKEAQY